jgi:hypothetical protein
VDDPLVQRIELVSAYVRDDVAPDDVAVVAQGGGLDVELTLREPAGQLGGDGAVGVEIGPGEGVLRRDLGDLGRPLAREPGALLLAPSPVGPGREINDVEPAGLAVGETVGVDGHGAPPR